MKELERKKSKLERLMAGAVSGRQILKGDNQWRSDFWMLTA
jgi:hypothetical protein